MNNLITRIMILIFLIILISFPISALSLKYFIKSIYKPKQIISQPIKEQPKVTEQNIYKDLYEKQLKINNELAKENTRIRLEMANGLASMKIEYERFLWNENYYTFYPTGCDYPKKTFTMCKEGCDIKFYCDTYSMNPLFWCNAKLTLKECSFYSVGDIILINNKNKKINKNYSYLIHSIIDIKSGNVVTKGFNNNGIDPFETPLNEIKGKVVKIEY